MNKNIVRIVTIALLACAAQGLSAADLAGDYMPGVASGDRISAMCPSGSDGKWVYFSTSSIDPATWQVEELEWGKGMHSARLHEGFVTPPVDRGTGLGGGSAGIGAKGLYRGEPETPAGFLYWHTDQRSGVGTVAQWICDSFDATKPALEIALVMRKTKNPTAVNVYGFHNNQRIFTKENFSSIEPFATTLGIPSYQQGDTVSFVLENAGSFNYDGTLISINIKPVESLSASAAASADFACLISASGQDPTVALTEFSLGKPASVDASSGQVRFYGGGKATFRSDVPISGIRFGCGVEGAKQSVIWVHPEGQLPKKINVSSQKVTQIDLVFEAVNSISLAFSRPSSTTPEYKLETAVLKLADGQERPLAGLFFKGHEKLGPHPIHFRNYPEPKTESITPEAARTLLNSEWTLQRAGRTLLDACKDELMRCQRIMERRTDKIESGLAVRLTQLEKRIESSSGADLDSIYLKLREVKRELMLSDPEIDFEQIVCIDVGYPAGMDNQSLHRTAAFAATGGRLLLLNGLGPDAGVSKLAPQDGASAAFWRPDVSFDASRVLFPMKPNPDGAFHLYEVNVDGKDLRQLTRGEYDDLDPVYSPDGGIVFATTRCNQFLPCGGSYYRMFILARCDADGRNIYFLSANHENDYLPEFLPDGRILFTRWEYYDKSVSRVQSLWTINPDGTALNAFWGNQSTWPDMLWNAAPIPGTHRVLFSAAGHHTPLSGSLGVVDQRQGMNYPDGLYKLTDIPWPEVGDGSESHFLNETFRAPLCYAGFVTPYPVSKNYFLVSARTGYSMPRTTEEPELHYHNLYLMDYDGNMELLHKGAYNILHAKPVRPRPAPPIIPSSVQWPGKMTAPDQQAASATFYSGDVYEGTTIPRGLVKSLRVLDAHCRHFSNMKGLRHTPELARPYQEKGAFPRCDVVGETPVSFIYADSPKRILGTVPVEDDGSVHFKVPPLRALYFQLLDERGRCLQTMRSMVHAMPGEVRGCVGCHETRATTPLPKPATAMRRAPSEITPPPWGDATVSFPRFVQPVLDRHCISCHNPTDNKGGFDFTHRSEDPQDFSWPYVKLVFGKKPRTFEEAKKTTIAGPIFTATSYENPEVKYPTRETVVPPMTAMSYRSKLIDIATSGKHHGVRVSPLEEAQLIAWVDALTPYNGLEELICRPDPDPKGNARFSYPALMRSAPMVHKPFLQDDFLTQDDRLPRDADGNIVPSIYFENGKMRYRIPEPKQEVKK